MESACPEHVVVRRGHHIEHLGSLERVRSPDRVNEPEAIGSLAPYGTGILASAQARRWGASFPPIGLIRPRGTPDDTLTTL
ncbi:hypothetical protein GCM10010315_31990 [Streptomyces luteosporeus]|uniref:Uncharacterized protein n=1 Tax=Streptomyces luteosporeus TaxID=173856 RepID=A0ABP6G6I3_9ACTN